MTEETNEEKVVDTFEDSVGPIDEPEETKNEEVSEENQEKPSEKVEEKKEEAPKEESIYLNFDDPDSLTPERVEARVKADTRKHYELKAKLEKAEKELLEERKKHLEANKPKEIKKPDSQLAEDDPQAFAQGLDAYYANVERQRKWEEDNNNFNQLQQQKAQEEQQKKLEQQQLKVNSFKERAEKDGFNFNDIQRAAVVFDTVVGQVAATQEQTQNMERLSQSFLANKYGHKLITDLASNPKEIAELVSMPYEAAVVKLHEKARGYQTPLKSKAPPPDEPLRGNGAPPESPYRLTQGGTFS